MESFKCPICGNSAIRYIGIRKGKQYCRKCITFRGQEATGEYVQSDNAEYTLHYELSEDQKRLSNQLVNNYKNGIDSLVHAVCGSGKTEIVLEVIANAMREGKRVGFALPRREVIIELYMRFRDIFTNNSVICVYGGHTNRLEANLVCLTTHQLFRYDHYFDLLIIDEIDAFPYRGNEVLKAFYKRSIKGVTILLSATPTKEEIEEYSKPGKSYLRLNKRFHGHPLPVPRFIEKKFISKYIVLLKITKELLSRSKQIFIFTPTIDICERTYKFLSAFLKNGNYVHSKREERAKIIDDFRKKKYMYLVTTAVLERGVTIKDLQVIVFLADHAIYDSHALIQISGRVGRKSDAPDGEIIYICRKNTIEIQESIKEIKKSNEVL